MSNNAPIKLHFQLDVDIQQYADDHNMSFGDARDQIKRDAKKLVLDHYDNLGY